jgi:hypothetical protein
MKVLTIKNSYYKNSSFLLPIPIIDFWLPISHYQLLVSI